MDSIIKIITNIYEYHLIPNLNSRDDHVKKKISRDDITNFLNFNTLIFF